MRNKARPRRNFLRQDSLFTRRDSLKELLKHCISLFIYADAAITECSRRDEIFHQLPFRQFTTSVSVSLVARCLEKARVSPLSLFLRARGSHRASSITIVISVTRRAREKRAGFSTRGALYEVFRAIDFPRATNLYSYSELAPNRMSFSRAGARPVADAARSGKSEIPLFIYANRSLLD